MSDTVVGRRIKAARVAAGLSQERLGAMAGVVGSTISRIERGYTPDMSTIEAVAGALGLPVASLLRSVATAPGAAQLPPPDYPAYVAFRGSEWGRGMSDAEATMLRSVRLPQGEEPTVELYLAWLTAYRLSRAPVGVVRRRIER